MASPVWEPTEENRKRHGFARRHGPLGQADPASPADSRTSRGHGSPAQPVDSRRRRSVSGNRAAHGKLEGLRDESKFRSWFFAVLLSMHRTRVRRPRRESVSIEDTLAGGNEPVGEDGTLWDEERRRAERAARALATLDPTQREAVVLHELDGFSVDEVAEMQQVTPSAVKSRLARGREKLRRFYLRNGWGSETQHREAAGTMAWPAKERSHE